MAKANSVKVQAMFPVGLHARLVAHAERSGLSFNQALLSLVDRSVSLNCELEPRTASKKESTPKDLERQEKQILQQMKPYNEKVSEGSITFVECDERYALIEQLAQVRTEMGKAKQSPEEIMQGYYTRELNMLTQQHEAEADDLFNPNSTPEFHKQYKDRAERINVLKDRLK